MELLSFITPCNPFLPDKAAAAFTLRSPPSVALDDQADRLPDSKSSAKIRSDEFTGGIGIDVEVDPGILVPVDIGSGVCVAVEAEMLVAVGGTKGVFVAVEPGATAVLVAVDTAIPVAVAGTIGVFVAVGLGVFVVVGTDPPPPTQLALPESVKVCPAIGTNCQS